jgi:hypothetical protein
MKAHALRRAELRRNAVVVATKPHGVNDGTPEIAHHVTYVFGKCESVIERYALVTGLPFATLAAGVCELLRHSQGRQVLGADN